MNIFTKLFFTASFITSSYAVAQQDSIHIIDLPTTINKDFSFDGLWRISNDGNTVNYKISGGKLTNNTPKISDPLYLDLYFVPSNSTVNLYNLPNKINTTAELGTLEGNGTSFNNVIITLKNSDIRPLSKGNYTPVLLLKEKTTGSIINYKILSNKITLEPNETIPLEPNEIIINKEIVTEPIPVTTPKEEEETFFYTEPLDASLANIYTSVGSTLDIEDSNKKLKLVGIWRLEVNFHDLTVKIDGINNAIQNLNSESTKKLKLLVYFSNQPIKDNNQVDGYELLNIDVLSISGNTKIEKPVFTSNITKLIPSGEYYPILVLTEQNDEGKYIIKSTLSFGDKYIWE